MLKNINIKSLLQAKDTLKIDGFSGFLKHYGIEIKSAEIEDLRSLVNVLHSLECSIKMFDKFYVGYKIPQIGKEFDLLRFGKKSVINLELKKTSTEEKIKKQLTRNRYYLSFIGREVYGFTFVSNSKELYFLKSDGSLEKAKFEFLVKLLNDQEVGDTEIVDELFEPSDYLVSPFNSTQKFLKNEYFLTHQQEEVKSEIIGSLSSPKESRFISITGSAGTGKTLLIYDIAKQLRESKKMPLIIHCGYLNAGQEELIKHGWKIISIRNYASHDLGNYDLVIIDEAQRIYTKQLDDIVEKVNLSSGNCIFSYDRLQTLSDSEEKSDIGTKINAVKAITGYKLSEKIRTNKEIAEFIKMLFNNKRNLTITNKGNVEINYFKSVEYAKSYLEILDGEKWEVLRFTPSQYNNEHHEKYSSLPNMNSHQVIGQEFDGVVVTIDQFFSYDKEGELIYRGSAYYQPAKMLFQNITRSRKKLNLVIIGNEELLNRCIAILQ
jgi:Cdc6-like AAA superfamily ATPase